MVDIVRETPTGELIGTEVKVLNTVKSEYCQGTKSSHRDNGDIYGFGNTRECVLRRVIGAKAQGAAGDAWFDHATGGGRIHGKDWEDTKAGEPKPAYKDALTRGHVLAVVVHEVWGGLDSGAWGEMSACAAKAKADGDSTDYASSNAVGAFATHWQRMLSITNLTSHGATLDAVGRTTYSETARARMAAAQQAWSVGADGGGGEGGGVGGSGRRGCARGRGRER